MGLELKILKILFSNFGLISKKSGFLWYNWLKFKLFKSIFLFNIVF